MESQSGVCHELQQRHKNKMKWNKAMGNKAEARLFLLD